MSGAMQSSNEVKQPLNPDDSDGSQLEDDRSVDSASSSMSVEAVCPTDEQPHGQLDAKPDGRNEGRPQLKSGFLEGASISALRSAYDGELSEENRHRGPSDYKPGSAITALETSHSNFVVDALSLVEPTLASVSNCGISFQNRFSSDPQLITLCLKYITDYYLTVDPTTRLNTFYVLNDLIQRDPRFRLGVLTDVLPRLYWAVSCLSDKEAYLKTVAVWEERKVYPREICAIISQLFQSADVASENAEEFESRLVSFTEMARIRAAKDVDLESLLRVGGGDSAGLESTAVNAETAAAIMAASPAELRSIGITARASLVVTQTTIEYLARLLVDFDDGLRTSNSKSMESLVKILGLQGTD